MLTGSEAIAAEGLGPVLPASETPTTLNPPSPSTEVKPVSQRIQDTMKVKAKVAQSCPTLCDLMDTQSMEQSRPEYWSG